MSQAEEKIDKKHSNKHHPYPKSRIPKRYHGGKKSLIGESLTIKAPSEKAHCALHAIFGNRTPKEQLVFLNKLCEYGRLNSVIFGAYKDAFDVLFGGYSSFPSLEEILKKWDLSEETRKKYTGKIAEIHRVLTKKIHGGIPLEDFKLN